ncbi:unnamed protein product, partial [Polarella glacialis]
KNNTNNNKKNNNKNNSSNNNKNNSNINNNHHNLQGQEQLKRQRREQLTRQRRQHLELDQLVMVGSAAEGLPGIPGFGPAVARQLLQMFGALDRVLDEAEHNGAALLCVRGIGQ